MTPAGISASGLIQISEDRIREGVILLSKGQFTGAAYISGYAIELLLKAVLATNVAEYRGIWPLEEMIRGHHVHNLEILLKHAGLKEQMRRAADVNFELASNWQTLRDQWGPTLRYRRLQKEIAGDIVRAVADHKDGVARWLRTWL